MKRMLATISTYNRFQLIRGAIFSILSIILTINTVQALTAQTTNTIKGRTLVLIDSKGNIIQNASVLATITLPKNITYNINHNKDIMLPKGDLRFSDIKTATLANNRTVNATSAFNNIGLQYYDLDNNTFHPVSGITGNYKAVWKNNRGEVITNLNDQISICFAPYTLTITSNNIKLSSHYGDPSVISFPNINKTYTFYHSDPPTVCYAKPSLEYGAYPHAGPSSQWSPTHGFLKQSDTDYRKNFPTTGGDDLYFDLIIGNLREPLRWPSVTVNGVTAQFSNITSSSVRVHLKGANQSNLRKFTSPTQIVLLGNNAYGQRVVKYGFSLSKWYIYFSVSDFTCYQYRQYNYRLPRVQDITNSKDEWLNQKGLSSGNYFQRAIGQGLLAEWGSLPSYTQMQWSSLKNSTWIDAKNYAAAEREGTIFAENGTMKKLNRQERRPNVCVSYQ